MSDDQAKHAQAFGAAATGIIESAQKFAADTQSQLSVLDVGRMYLAAGVALAQTAAGPNGTAQMLRQLADAIEAARPTVN